MTGTDGLDRFCQQTYPRLVGALDLYTGDLDLAEELAQEALIRAAKRWSKVRELDSPGGWTYRVAINLANSRFRRRQARRRAVTRLGNQATADLGVETDVANRDAVRSAVNDLPATQRAAVVLRYYLGLSGPEAAAALDISHDALRARLKRAVASLRDRLGPVAGELKEASDAV